MWNVLCKPALIPLGGSLVTFNVFYNKPNGKLGFSSQVIQSLNSSCNGNLGASGLIILVSISSIYFRPKWQFCKIIHPPCSAHFSIYLLATISYPSPIDTLSQGNFFFFLANSSMVVVGSAPADNKYNTGSKFLESLQISSIE